MEKHHLKRAAGSSVVVYMIWRGRNARIFSVKESRHGELIMEAKNQTRSHVGAWHGVKKSLTKRALRVDCAVPV